MMKTDLQENEIVQLKPDTCHNPAFGGCLMIVTEPKSWGAQGYIPTLSEEGQGQAYYRATWEEMEQTGGRLK